MPWPRRFPPDCTLRGLPLHRTHSNPAAIATLPPPALRQMRSARATPPARSDGSDLLQESPWLAVMRDARCVSHCSLGEILAASRHSALGTRHSTLDTHGL